MTQEPDYWTQQADRYRRRFETEMCEHMRALVLHCERVGVIFGGCGDCGSAWLECMNCSATLDNAHEVFERVDGGRPKGR